jgi:hypothetical protein
MEHQQPGEVRIVSAQVLAQLQASGYQVFILVILLKLLLRLQLIFSFKFLSITHKNSYFFKKL